MCYKNGKFYDRREMLKVKLKSLAEEARIIRKEERKAPPSIQNELYAHRIHVVRKAARATHIAYGIIRGRAWQDMEANAKPQEKLYSWDLPFFEDVQKMVRKYGNHIFSEWKGDDMAAHPDWTFPRPDAIPPLTLKERLAKGAKKLWGKQDKEVA